MCQGLTHFFFPQMIMKDMKVIWQTSYFPAHMLCTSESSKSHEMSVAKKNRLLFSIRQVGSCETAFATSRSFVSEFLSVEVHLQEPNLQILQVHRRWCKSFLHSWLFTFEPYVTQLMCRMLHSGWGCCCPVLAGTPLSWQSILARVIQGQCLRMHYKEERAFSTGISVSELLWTDPRLEESRRGRWESARYSWVLHRYYLPLLISP